MTEYFSKTKCLGVNIKIELDLSHYPTKVDIKNTTGADTSHFAEETGLANLKSDVDKLDIDKLENISSNLSNLKSKVNKLYIGKLETTPVDLN